MTNLQKALIALAAMCLLAVASHGVAQALMLQPTQIDLQSNGAGSSSSFQVTNDRNRVVTVEINVLRVSVPETGASVATEDSGDNFLIFPPQASIAPGATQTFRVRWVGEPMIPESQLYMLEAAELPVEMGDGQSGVQVLYAIRTLVAVAPPRGEAALDVASVQRAVNSEGARGVNLTVRNQGNQHAYLSRSLVRLGIAEPDRWERALEPARVGSLVGLGLIPANARRTFFLPLDDVPAEGLLEARVDSPPS